MRIIKPTICLLLVVNIALPCTIAVATGTKTVGGNPLLFKNRDTKTGFPADVAWFDGGTSDFSYVYHRNTGQSHNYMRMGINDQGLGIVYTDAENLSGTGSGPSGSQLSAIALKTCSAIQDFRTLLDDTNGSRNVSQIFGVIDSNGCGSIFEVDGYSWIEIAVVDTAIAIANTALHHPSAGPPVTGSTSADRVGRATWLLNNGPATGLDYEYFIEEISKDYSENQSDEDQMPIGQYTTNSVLSRYKTVSACVIQGAHTNAELSLEVVMWLSLGEPSITPFFPFNPQLDMIPQLLTSTAPAGGMAASADHTKAKIYDYSFGRYTDRSANTTVIAEIQQELTPMQDSIFSEWEKQIQYWMGMNLHEAKQEMPSWFETFGQEIKSQYDALIAYVDIDEEPKYLISSTRITVQQNYPNPFNQSTYFPVSTTSLDPIKLDVYTLSGKLVLSKLIQSNSIGKLDIPFVSPANFAAGTYICRFSVGKDAITHRMNYLP